MLKTLVAAMPSGWRRWCLNCWKTPGSGLDRLIGSASISARAGLRGTRVGVAFARGLALSTGMKALGVSNLDALALRADPEGARTVMAIHDAKRGDLVWRMFTHGRPVTEISYGDARDAADEFEAFGDVILTGSGAVHLGADPSHFDPKPPLHALLALTSRAPADAPAPSPLYVRPPDAKLPGGQTPA